MITDRIGQHKRLLQVNHKYINMYDILGFFKIKTQEILKIFASGEWKKKKHFSAQLRWCLQSNYLGKTRSGLLAVKSEQLIANQICEFCCFYDLFSDGNKTSISCRPIQSVIIRMKQNRFVHH